uniref:Mitochondrial potassium channel ATP-binding subunit n=1 Tax=Ciona savignyi TaxID=51511 RepID=H2YA86_CIOSA
ALIGAVVNMRIPSALGDLINILNEQATAGLSTAAEYMTGLRGPVMQLVSLYLCQGLATFAYISLLSHLGEKVACKMRKNLFESLLRQDVAFHDQRKTGELIDRLTSDVQDFKSSFKLCISQGIRSTTQTIGCICSLYSTSAKLTLALAATIPIIVLIGLFLNSGQLMSFLVSAQMIQRSLASLSVLSGSAVRGITAGSRVFEYIHLQPSIPITGGRKIPYHCLLGHLRFEDVHFTYPQRPDHEVLKGVTLDIKPCQTVALCGLSGAGKSTIASLAERFYDPTSGNITLDGVDITQLDPSWLRGRTIGYINQEPVLFSGSVEDNIRYGRPDATKDEVVSAAKLANADSFITNFPSGYATVVGERGLALSGGQKQRIAIARALLKNPSILILDEATSALDAESERLVQEALDRVMVDRTVLIIAHRLSTIKNADVIAVMKHGKVVEVGNHKELKKKGGIYSELIKLQESNG